MTDAPRHARGRHAKPPSEFSRACDRALRILTQERTRRKLVVVWSGTASVALTVVAVMGAVKAGMDREPTTRAAGAITSAHGGHRSTTGRPATTTMAARTPLPAGHSDNVGVQAISFIRQRDPGEKVVRHVEKIVQSGDFLRVYTDLPEGNENSPSAISLCEWTTRYLADLRGDKDPIVFIHAKTGQNGSVILANKQDAKDSCKVDETR